MAKYIDPQCGRQIYLMDDENIAGNCGWLEGLIGAIVCTVIVCIIISSVVSYTMSEKEVVDKNGRPIKQTNTSPYIIISIICCVLILVWVFTLVGSTWLSKSNWRSNQAQIEGYMNSGMSKAAAIDKMQDMQEAMMKAEATRSISRSMENNRSGNYRSSSGKNITFGIPGIGINF
jgi:hypothetical protein